ncbi:biotin transporter BioY [Nesterenkonia massiliensis]|uniref:Biotin transporter BioY n=1 Tax=Nesterenkonia massiliensis TaxID=1232429 RepID=A0ABT2HSG4_9MICC|nr:biotin transporter BioY [Nesterenkonia massiliensis]MCT1607649.1 biotin transporter BioY [Nesterenkonia massiliensis]
MTRIAPFVDFLQRHWAFLRSKLYLMVGTTQTTPHPRQSTQHRGVTPAVTAISQMAVFAALVAVLGQVAALPIGPVPITLQTLGVMLAGAVLGPWRGAGSMLLLNLLTAAGLPLMSQGAGGLGVYAGPSAGFVLGFVPAAFVIGLVVQASWPMRWWRTVLGVVVGGVGVMYACGLPVMMYQLGLALPEALAMNAVFLPGDAAKAVFTILVTHSLARAYPAPFTYARRRRRIPAA